MHGRWRHWDERGLKSRTESIFQQRDGFDPAPCYESGLVVPAGSCQCHQGCRRADDVPGNATGQHRQTLLLPGQSHCDEGDGIRWANRYAELAREMAAKEKDEVRKAELVSLAETCERVPEHPARNLREVMQCHFYCHLAAELEQVGCGYSEAYLGQNLQPYYQADKDAGLIDYDDAVFMFQNLVVRLNEINYYYGEKVALQNSATWVKYYPCGLYRRGGRCHGGDGLRDPRCLHLSVFSPATIVLCTDP